MVAPVKLAHVVLKTGRMQEMIDWYSQVLDGRPVYSNDMLGFMTYDDEHHRVAFLALGSSVMPEMEHTGLEHFAFTYEKLGDLVGTYKRLKEKDIKPVWVINHGMTVSMYYADPDGNRIELQIDNFPDAESTQEYLLSDEFQKNPIGVEFDPDEFVARFEAGEPESELTKRT
ncbi:VOC family protein [Streptomyces sp. NPDC101455]|uniref:VOC family protein n=1 Tax=Streptomyces sp. NPDC101455 TaxID=3366142 RepID=UPI003828BB12